MGTDQDGTEGRLHARPDASFRPHDLAPGVHTLAFPEDRSVELLVPSIRNAQRPTPLLVMLHGAGGDAAQVVAPMIDGASEHEALVLSPKSKAATWDVIRGGFGPDVDLIDQALAAVFERWSIDPARIAIGGFSDGASYALSLGLSNGDLFSDILAFSPGFAAPAVRRGQPHVFISHGERDQVLPIARCGRPLARKLTEAGYDVEYDEFQGGHIMPLSCVAAAWTRFMRAK